MATEGGEERILERIEGSTVSNSLRMSTNIMKMSLCGAIGGDHWQSLPGSFSRVDAETRSESVEGRWNEGI